MIYKLLITTQKSSRSLIIREIEMNIIIRYLFTPAKLAIKGKKEEEEKEKKLKRKGQKKNNVRTREFGRLVDC